MTVNNPISVVSRSVYIPLHIGYLSGGQIYVDNDRGGIPMPHTEQSWCSVSYQMPSGYVSGTFKLHIIGSADAASGAGDGWYAVAVGHGDVDQTYDYDTDSDSQTLDINNEDIIKTTFDLTFAESGIAADQVVTISLERDTTSISDTFDDTIYLMAVIVDFDETLVLT